MIFGESAMLRWSDTGEDMLEMLASELPDARGVQGKRPVKALLLA